ncbi:hypothetical protein MMC12_002715 [Toensbergia leucococca]|nr:hypothetical protein [Toensbergia leucococca]
MGNELIISIGFAFITIAIVAAWVGGYLDAYQSKAQAKALDMMGENKASYGIKSTITGQKVTDDKDFNELQGGIGDGVGGLVGKGGIGEEIGAGLSKGLSSEKYPDPHPPHLTSAELISLLVSLQINQFPLPPGIDLVSADDFKEWRMDIRVLDPNPLYLNQTFRLRFRFSNNYPIESPEVTFMTSTHPPRVVPMHPHIYTNGIICLDLLGTQGWSPVQNVESVCMSIQSMLTGNDKNERPQGDEDFCRRNTQRPRDIRFDYHDDDV